MESVIDNDAPLDYVQFHLFSNHDRFEACACSGEVTEKIACGLLGQLLLHSPKLKDLFSRGSKASFQIKRPKDLDNSQWFTKATVTRFLHIIGSVDLLDTSISIQNEINQLEEAKKFHFSLHTKDESETATSDASKNELLQAMELRLTASKTELAATINRAAGTNCLPKHIYNVEKLAEHLGNMNFRNTLRKLEELCPVDQKIDLPFNSSNKSSDESVEKTQTKKPSLLDTPVKYGVSPAKAAQIERQSSSDLSEDEQPAGERSRSLARSASPRRAASPMRRVQIGRSGSRRATALTIKSLNHFPGRDKTESSRDNYSSDEEGSEKPARKSNSNALRISVKDAISLFENKQQDHPSDGPKRSPLDVSLGANKSVLRRWSAGLRDPQGVSESSSQLNSENAEIKYIHEDIKVKENDKVDEILHSIEERMSKPIESKPDILVIHHEEDAEKLTASAEWNRQKEAELNEMLTMMMQSKPVRNRKTVNSKNRPEKVELEKRGGFYDQYKGKRDEKLRGETMEKRAEKDAQFRAMEQNLEQRKATMASANAEAVTRSKNSLSKPEKLRKSVTPSEDTKKKSPKPDLSNKSQSKTKPSLVRKSTGISPAKTACGPSSAGTTPTRRKTQQGPSAPIGLQPSPKVERPVQRPKFKPVNDTQTDSKTSKKGTNEKQQQLILKSVEISKTKQQSISGKVSSKDTAKPNLYSKVTKKSSVVPLESKPSLRKGTGPVLKAKKASSLPKKLVKKPENLIAVEECNFGANNLESVSEQIPPKDVQSEDTCAGLEFEAQLAATEKVCNETRHCEQVIKNCDDRLVERSESELETAAVEDLMISPTVWVEEREDSCIPPEDSTCKILSSVATTSSPRVRHSLSQMLLQESAEVDMAEWGNAETLPSLMHEKEPPKGLKRLLKFAGPQRSYAHPNSSNYGAQSSSKRLQEHISGAATSTRATRSFFSLSALRGQQPK